MSMTVSYSNSPHPNASRLFRQSQDFFGDSGIDALLGHEKLVGLLACNRRIRTRGEDFGQDRGGGTIQNREGSLWSHTPKYAMARS